jgi:23S rRNA pseudouridine1911/1915/1917 synthase
MRRLSHAADAAPLRLDRFLCERLPGCSRRRAKEIIAAGRVRVDGRRARKGQEVAAGAVVEVEESEEPQRLQPNPRLGLRVLYADEAVVAVDKPAGMPAHALEAGETDTVANFLLARYPETGELGGALEPGLVHRLDNDTSGVLLAARTAAAHAALRRQFAEHRIVKKYIALVRGEVKQAATIDAPIEHVRGSARRMRVAEPGKGREAVTHYVPLRRVGSHTLLELEMRTGVRHQIRVHLAAIGHPVAGDLLYDEGADARIGRHLLHATSVTFVHPVTGEKVTVHSEPTAEFRG